MSKFNISKRTVFRDLRVISELGVPVTHYPETGYGVLRDGMIPPIMFTFRELSVIMMGLSFVKSQVDPEMVNDAESVSLKIRSTVPATLQEQMNILEKKTNVSPYIQNVENRQTGGDWFTLCSSFVEEKPVFFSYRDKKGVLSTRTIDPLLLVHYTDHWNVIGFCHDRKALRNFMLSRMQDIVLRDRPILRKKEYTLRELLYRRSDKEHVITISIHLEKSFSFLSELPGEVVERGIVENRMHVTFLIDDLDFINEWLLRFGQHVKIIAPDDLLLKRKNYLNMLLENH